MDIHRDTMCSIYSMNQYESVPWPKTDHANPYMDIGQ